MVLHYLQKGTGTPVVLLHGFCESLRIWDGMIDALAEDHHVIAIDLPGFGENAALTELITIEEMADQVYRTLHELGVISGVLVGHSLGGYVSLALAEKYPPWMQGLCLFHSTAYADDEAKRQKRDKAIEFIREHGIEAFNDGLIPSLFASSRQDNLWDTIREVKELANQTSAQSAIQVTQAMKNRPDRTSVLREANYPVMFIAGREDEAVSVESIHSQCFLPPGTVSVHLLSEVGHMGMYEAPSQTRRMLLVFLEAR